MILTNSKIHILFYALVLACGAFFLSARLVYAVNYQLDQYQTASAVYSNLNNTPVLQTFFPTKPNIAGFYKTGVLTSTSSVQIAYFVCRGIPDIENINTKYNCGNDGNLKIAEGITLDLNPTGTNKTIGFEIIPPWPNYGNFNYYVSLIPIGGNARFIFAPYSAGSWSNINQRGYGDGIPDGYSMYYLEFYDADNARNIFLINPIDNTINDQSLTSFDLAINIDETFLFSNWTIRIDYGTSSNNFAYSDKLTTKFDLGGWQEIGIIKTNALSSAQYYWRASAYIASDDYGLAYATSTIETFEIDNLAQTGDLYIFDEPTEQEICEGIATSTFFGAIECGFKKVLTWAFYPKSGSVEDFKQKASLLGNDFPFNTLFDITGGIKRGIASSTIDDNSNFKIPFIDGDKEIYMMPVLSSTSLPKLIGEDNTETFRYTQGIFIYIIFLIAVYFIARKAI